MILTFKPQFIEPIKAGTKIHTIRTDAKNRWKPGMKIQFWSSNPRNVKSSPYQFGAGECKKVNDIKIDFQKESITITNHVSKKSTTISYFELLNEFAQKDGFLNWDYMKEWFLTEYPGVTEFIGKLIYFEANTSFIVSEDQNTIICYGETYKMQIGNCIDECDLNKKRKCSKTPCFSGHRKDKQSFIIFKKEKAHEPR